MPKHVKRASKVKRSMKAGKPTKTRALTLGLVGFATISAVEGISLRSSTREMFADFERRKLTPEERRRAIFEKHAKKA